MGPLIVIVIILYYYSEAFGEGVVLETKFSLLTSAEGLTNSWITAIYGRLVLILEGLERVGRILEGSY